MRITNKYGLPDAIYAAARNDSYSRGNSDISVTQLIDSPRVVYLREKHNKDMEDDLVNRIWALLGQGVHTILERAGGEDAVVEERLFLKVGDWTISGAADVQKYAKPPTIVDYKVTGAWSLMDIKPSWERQLNCLAYLVYMNKNIRVGRLEICCIVRDWQRSRAAREPDYPQRPIVVVPIPLWSVEDQETYVRARTDLHRSARMADEDEMWLPQCSDEDQWRKPASWAVKKAGGKRALRVFDIESEAQEFLQAEAGRLLEVRGGEPTRCVGDYCGVSRWCRQRNDELKNHPAT